MALSLLPHFSYEAGVQPPDASDALNYGFDKVRFLSPVTAGARVREAPVVPGPPGPPSAMA